MFKNLSIKFLALVLAIIFWFFVVSLENTFYKFPDEVPVQIFNQGQELALASTVSGVHLTVKVSDPVTLKNLTAGDFEAYIDLRNMAVGTRKMEVFVTSKNPQVSVVKVEPSEIEVSLEPLKEKLVTIKADVAGQPMKGHKIDTVKLSKDKITVAAAESVLSKIGQVKALVQLDGTEDASVTKNVIIKVFDANGAPLEGVKVSEKNPVEVNINIIETETQREVGVHPVFLNSAGRLVKSIQVDPSIVTITGSRELLDKISTLETEPIDLKDIFVPVERSVKLILPPGVKLGSGQKRDVQVNVDIVSN